MVVTRKQGVTYLKWWGFSINEGNIHITWKSRFFYLAIKKGRKFIFGPAATK